MGPLLALGIGLDNRIPRVRFPPAPPCPNFDWLAKLAPARNPAQLSVQTDSNVTYVRTAPRWVNCHERIHAWHPANGTSIAPTSLLEMVDGSMLAHMGSGRFASRSKMLIRSIGIPTPKGS